MSRRDFEREFLGRWTDTTIRCEHVSRDDQCIEVAKYQIIRGSEGNGGEIRQVRVCDRCLPVAVHRLTERESIVVGRLP
jgi:hypothetical protein